MIDMIIGGILTAVPINRSKKESAKKVKKEKSKLRSHFAIAGLDW